MEIFGDTSSEELKKLCRDNAEYYGKDDTENGQRLRLGFLGIVDHINSILPLVISTQNIMAAYDFDEGTPGNGYRSFVVVVQATFKHAIELCTYITLNRDSFIFRKSFYMKEVEAVCHMIASLVSCFQHLQTLLNWCGPGELFPSAEHHSHILLEQSDTVNQYAFYGRCLGIQFCSSVQPLLRFISIFMASFSEMYYNIGGLSARAQSLFSGSKFLIDPELRARRIVHISQYASIDFCKSFWFLAESEIMKRIPDFVCDAIAINTEIQIPPEPLEMYNLAGSKINIPIPSSHKKVSDIQVRLLSSSKREGMISVSPESSTQSEVTSPADSLIFHCHGGGFVAQSSKSHEVYLRDWASSLNVPILSIDYSLAPEAPFPRALEEVFYSYCWALKNCHILGSTGKKIIFAGDSAGANLLLGAALKCVDYGIRKPNGLFLAYVPVIVSSTPSPSRLLCLMDPLLPIGFLLRCLKAYASPEEIADDSTTAIDEENKASLSENHSKVFFKYSNPDRNFNENSTPVQGTDLSDFPEQMCELSECSANVSSVLKTTDKKFSNLGNGKDLDSALEVTESTDISNWESNNGDSIPVLLDLNDKIEPTEKNFKNAFNAMRKRVSSFISNSFRTVTKNDIDKMLIGSEFDETNLVNPFKKFNFSVPKDPFMSPYWAPDDMLRQLPPTSICSVQFDPCLDDCVMFAKKLKKLGNTVSLDVLEGLPHGFLNFSKVNKDAHEGSKICLKRIKELLTDQPSVPTQTKPNEEGDNDRRQESGPSI